ncbi:MAG: PDDEXK nuclease domain-containing protein [Holophaga sp.]|jgi:predicted nuclease of restriction endonuclease-like (RecB) superfamily
MVETSATADPHLLLAVREIWEDARNYAARTVNTAMIRAHWLIGRQIVEAQQAGKRRAGYGEELIANLSRALHMEYGSGFSAPGLKFMRAFYLAYPDLVPIGYASRSQSIGQNISTVTPIGHALRSQFEEEPGWKPGKLHTSLSWTHYRTLLKVNQRDARDFYEIEAIRNGWSARALERQIDSLLFFRLAKSRDKKGVLALANEGIQVERPVDAIRDPYVLEFLDLPESHRLVESELQTALITRLQDFLLELGSGFAFVGRQKRITLDGDHFYPDLVFYHTRLKCYVVIDLKTAKLTHGDLGQMLLYVGYYDKEVAEAGDNPTLGLILCTDKNDAVVRFVLGKDDPKIFASRYKLHLPTEEELRAELEREMASLAEAPVAPRASRKKRDR